MRSLTLFAKKATYSLHETSKDVPQILIVLGVCICTMMMGIMLTWPSPSIPQLLEPEYGITIDEASYLTVIDPIAMFIGSPIFAILADKIGRRPTMSFVPFTFTASLVITALTKNIYVLYVSRIFSGLCNACCFSSVPTYLGEITTPKIRDKYGHFLMTTAYVGQLLTNLAGLHFNIPTMAYVLLTIPAIGLIILYFVPETPYYYVMKNDMDSARKSLEIIRGTKNVDEELIAITNAVERQLAEPGHFKDLFTIPSNRKAFIICNIARLIQQASGIITFISYSQYIFEQAGTRIASGYGSMIFAAMLVISNPFSNIICDKFGKRQAMVYSCAGVFIALQSESIFFFLKQYTVVDVTPVNWFPIFGLTLFVVFFCIGQSNVPTLLMGELFSSNIKPHGVMFLNMIFAIYMASMNKIFQSLMSRFGLCIPFSITAVFVFIGIFLSYYLIPETKGKTLEEIQMTLKGDNTNSSA